MSVRTSFQQFALGRVGERVPAREIMKIRGNAPEYTADKGKPLIRQSKGEEGLKIQKRLRTSVKIISAGRMGRRCHRDRQKVLPLVQKGKRQNGWDGKFREQSSNPEQLKCGG